MSPASPTPQQPGGPQVRTAGHPRRCRRRRPSVSTAAPLPHRLTPLPLPAVVTPRQVASYLEAATRTASAAAEEPPPPESDAAATAADSAAADDRAGVLKAPTVASTLAVINKSLAGRKPLVPAVGGGMDVPAAAAAAAAAGCASGGAVRGAAPPSASSASATKWVQPSGECGRGLRRDFQPSCWLMLSLHPPATVTR